ncbi:MAG: YafY family transcriptional regulator [Spirochaetaceae bacterium]|jgi:predicted DNA-binding transcriptional regulator YafY|nr:YafY family transcriptional regulator [Spirochaetaceae bacterium]
MKKLERIIAIIMLMLRRKQVSASKLAQMFEVSLRTIYRDMETIGYAGIPLFSTQGPNGGYGIVEDYKIEKGLFTTSDIIAMLTAALYGTQSVYNDKNIVNAIAKIQGLFTDKELHAIETKSRQITIDHTPWFGMETLMVDLKVDIEEIINAITNKNLLKIVYTNYSGEPSERQVEPYRLLLKSANWYLIAFCLSKQEFRVFKLSRISRLEILDDLFERQDCDSCALSLAGQIELEKKVANEKRQDYCR